MHHKQLIFSVAREWAGPYEQSREPCHGRIVVRCRGCLSHTYQKTHISADLLRLLLLSILNAHQNYVDNISLAFMQKSIQTKMQCGRELLGWVIVLCVITWHFDSFCSYSSGLKWPMHITYTRTARFTRCSHLLPVSFLSLGCMPLLHVFVFFSAECSQQRMGKEQAYCTR